MHYNASNAKRGTLFVAVKLKKRPISNIAVSFILRAAYAIPVHLQTLAYHELSLNATCKDVDLLTKKLQKQYNCKTTDVTITKEAFIKLIKNK